MRFQIELASQITASVPGMDPTTQKPTTPLCIQVEAEDADSAVQRLQNTLQDLVSETAHLPQSGSIAEANAARAQTTFVLPVSPNAYLDRVQRSVQYACSNGFRPSEIIAVVAEGLQASARFLHGSHPSAHKQGADALNCLLNLLQRLKVAGYE